LQQKYPNNGKWYIFPQIIRKIVWGKFVFLNFFLYLCNIFKHMLWCAF
jgi:hypothetical protein